LLQARSKDETPAVKIEDDGDGYCAGVELVRDENVDGNVVGWGAGGEVEDDWERRIRGEAEEGVWDCSRKTD